MSQRLVPVCGDDPPLSEGSPFVECSSVVWVADQSSTDLRPEDIAELFPAIALFFASIFVWRFLRKVL